MIKNRIDRENETAFVGPFSIAMDTGLTSCLYCHEPVYFYKGNFESGEIIRPIDFLPFHDGIKAPSKIDAVKCPFCNYDGINKEDGDKNDNQKNQDR